MQPGSLVLSLILLPLLASNGAYLLSAYEGHIPWCIPYIEGCTTISRAARSGTAVYFFRATMIIYSVLLILFWIYTRHWLKLLHGHISKMSNLIFWLGIVSTFALMIYIDFLGTTGEVNRFMRRYGIMMFFTLTPLAQLLLLNQHFTILKISPETDLNRTALKFQIIVLLLMLCIGLISVLLGATGMKSYQSENIVEWNFSLLLTMYFVGMVFIWKDYRLIFTIRAD